MHRVLIVALATSTTACLFPSLGDLSGADASTDAPTDATEAGDASDGGGPAAIDDFEQDCAPWNGINATASTSSLAHGGKSSCQICCAGTGNYCTFDRGTNPIVPVVVGKTYKASAWVRVAPQTTNANLTSGILEREILANAYTAASPYVEEALSQAWTLHTNQLTITDPGDGLNLYIALGNYAAGDCFLVDDVSVTVAP
jgi:hypothetical protein